MNNMIDVNAQAQELLEYKLETQAGNKATVQSVLFYLSELPAGQDADEALAEIFKLACNLFSTEDVQIICYIANAALSGVWMQVHDTKLAKGALGYDDCPWFGIIDGSETPNGEVDVGLFRSDNPQSINLQKIHVMDKAARKAINTGNGSIYTEAFNMHRCATHDIGSVVERMNMYWGQYVQNGGEFYELDDEMYYKQPTQH